MNPWLPYIVGVLLLALSTGDPQGMLITIGIGCIVAAIFLIDFP